MNDPTRFASIITPPGRGAIATVQVNGPGVQDVVSLFFKSINGRPISAEPLFKIIYGRWHSGELESAEDVVVCRHSDEKIEIHCHGGDLPPRLIADSLVKSGITLMDWQEAGETSSTNAWQAESTLALINAPTIRSANWLQRNNDGRVPQEIKSIATELSNPQDDETVHRCRERLIRLQQSFEFGKCLIDGWILAIAGKPNVGKSSIINRLLGFERAIVFDEPGTTRDIVSHQTAFAGLPVRISDTAGLRDSRDAIESAGINLARQTFQESHLTIYVSDLSVPWNDQDAKTIAELPDVILVHNKCDLREMDDRPNGNVISATEDQGIGELVAQIEKKIFQFPDRSQPILTARWQVEAIDRALIAIQNSDLKLAIEAIDPDSRTRR